MFVGNVTGSNQLLLVVRQPKSEPREVWDISVVQEHTSTYRVCVTSCFYIKL